MNITFIYSCWIVLTVSFFTLIDQVYCPRRVLAQTAKTRGGTLGPPAYREENFAASEKISIFENTARKGLPKVRWGSNKQAKDSGSVLYTTRF